ncbi:MAG: hypothetical protein IIU11_03535 [Bacteroidales bacterium]|jgi:hypothetical protein|nr:hypothetical protein [Bacteroidales bacterium]MBR6279455.1 hypothetical protein [Bacteroidales bacterium]
MTIFNKILLFLLVFLPEFLYGQYKVEWAQTFGGDGWDEAASCVETRDGDYVVAGFAKQQEHHLWIVKMRRNGQGRWGKTFADYFISAAKSIISTSDSNLVVTGYAIRKRDFQSNLLLMKLDTLGNILWQKTFGGDGDEQGLKVIETRDGGYAIAGFSSSNNDAEPNWYVIKTDRNGNLQWEKQYGGSNDDRAFSIAQTYDNGFVVTGYIGSGDGGRKLMSIIKLDADGTDIWSQNYDLNNWTSGAAIIATRDSLIVAAGYTRAYSITDYDLFVVKTDMNGDTLWTRTYGDEHWQESTDIVETFDNCFVVSGFSMSNIKDLSSFLMVKYNPEGDMMWKQVFKRKSQDYAKSIIETRDNGLLLAGTTFSYGKGWDMAVLKMKHFEGADVIFTFPKDSLSTTLNKRLAFNLCLKNFGTPSKVKVIVNDKPVIGQAGFNKLSDEEKENNSCYPLSYQVDLSEGFNTIKVEVTDYKDYIFDKQICVYSLPRYDF